MSGNERQQLKGMSVATPVMWLTSQGAFEQSA